MTLPTSSSPFVAGDCSHDPCPYEVCEWCNGAECQTCGYTGHELDPVTGEPIKADTDDDMSAIESMACDR